MTPTRESAGRIVSFDAAGGWNIEEEGYQSVGSGSIFAKSSMKKLYSQVTDADSALRVAVEALYDAADDDSATGGPDLVRGIYPTAVIIGADGAAEVTGEPIAELAREVIESRSRADTFGPDGSARGETVSFPYFISPEQAMRERSELARKGIARGRSVVALAYAGGVLFVAENPSRSLQKISELYDRVGFAAAGKFNEFDNLRRGGIQFADTRGYAYDRRDVTGRQLANVYAQTLGTIFTEQAKPYEVELCVAEVAHYGETKPPELYRITYDGSIADEPHFVVMGGTTEPIITALKESYAENADLPTPHRRSPWRRCGPAVRTPRAAISRPSDVASLEVAILDANRPRRAFRRITGAALESLLHGSGFGRPETGDAAPDSRRRLRRTNRAQYRSSALVWLGGRTARGTPVGRCRAIGPRSAARCW